MDQKTGRQFRIRLDHSKQLVWVDGRWVPNFIHRFRIGPVFVWFGGPARVKPGFARMVKSIVLFGLGRFVWVGWVVTGTEV